MKNPWKKISDKEIYDNPWIKVEEHQIINPSGNEGIYGKVHFKNKALGIVPLDDELNTWLVGQYRYTLDEYTWEIPMGGGLIDVDVLESAKRELKEETGLVAASWQNILRIHTSNSVTDEEGFVFVAKDLTQGETAFDDTEDLKIRKLKLSEAVRLVMSNEITDSLSIAGLLKTKLLLDEGKL
ncbi:NUDIX hydrolase [Reichenbachiella carrageenanivorans]|uniref:GDP-mannose pyrophosphatase n=1 Tax=Reichenbachiella carrageenanivorans TaxID=2979869 RepID=A0ABY6CZV6_9BACT|nr:NUDIX hydrolase [Reichenbachiella carrageenanivorans]UXX79454.1 NUDIX hydrolase [Reichenbachiella carrageenanivorans]